MSVTDEGGGFSTSLDTTTGDSEGNSAVQDVSGALSNLFGGGGASSSSSGSSGTAPATATGGGVLSGLGSVLPKVGAALLGAGLIGAVVWAGWTFLPQLGASLAHPQKAGAVGGKKAKP